MENHLAEPPPSVVASLEHLTGRSSGNVSWLAGDTMDICLLADGRLHIANASPGKSPTTLIARLHAAERTYELEVPKERTVWVNGDRVTSRRLENCDLIELDEAGPLCRFRLHDDNRPPRKTVGEILADCADYMKASRQPLLRRVVRGLGELSVQLTRQTTVLFRLAVVLAITVLAGLVYQQYLHNARLRQSIESETARLDTVAAAVARARQEALRPNDLSALRDEIGQRLTSSVERLEVLERRSKAAGRVIAESLASIGFIQGSYAFRQVSSGLMLRHVVDAKGRPLVSPLGQPLLTVEGEGPIAELQFIGTGFLVGEDGVLVTNRHVAHPWETATGTAVLASGDLEPVMTRFIVYFPGRAEPVEIEPVLASDSADLAVLRAAGLADTTRGLRLAEELPSAGDEVIVMGYPTGLRSMLAQSGSAFLEALMQSEDTGFWTIAKRLAEQGLISPLASRGIVGQVTDATIVYDAETTHGGSGGPVLDTEGRVIAVNTAILPEYGGSNLGVPAARVRALLDEAGLLH